MTRNRFRMLHLLLSIAMLSTLGSAVFANKNTGNCDCYSTWDCEEVSGDNWYCRTVECKPVGQDIRCCDNNGKSKKKCVGQEEANVLLSVDLWTAAYLQPALAGGGPADPDLAAQATGAVTDPQCGEAVGYEVFGMLSACLGPDFAELLDSPEGPVVWLSDISGDPCRMEAANLCHAAIQAELTAPGSSYSILDQIQLHCPQGLPFATLECEGPPPLDCLFEGFMHVTGGLAD